MRITNFGASKKQEGVKKYANAPLWRTFLPIPQTWQSPRQAATRTRAWCRLPVILLMAVSLAFGILFATLIALIVIPVLLGLRLDATALIGGSECAAEMLT